jgi:hypothetical protein
MAIVIEVGEAVLTLGVEYKEVELAAVAAVVAVVAVVAAGAVSEFP